MTEYEIEEVARRACAKYSTVAWETVPASVRERWIAEARAAVSGGADGTKVGQTVRQVLGAYLAEQEAVSVAVPTQPLSKKTPVKGRK